MCFFKALLAQPKLPLQKKMGAVSLGDYYIFIKALIQVS